MVVLMSKYIGGVMHDRDRVATYRRSARACLELALRTEDTKTRALFVAMAQSWNDLASRDTLAGLTTAIEAFNERQLIK